MEINIIERKEEGFVKEIILNLSKEELLKLKQMTEHALASEQSLQETRDFLEGVVKNGSMSKEDATTVDTFCNSSHPSTGYFQMDSKEIKIGFNPKLEEWKFIKNQNLQNKKEN